MWSVAWNACGDVRTPVLAVNASVAGGGVDVGGVGMRRNGGGQRSRAAALGRAVRRRQPGPNLPRSRPPAFTKRLNRFCDKKAVAAAAARSTEAAKHLLPVRGLRANRSRVLSIARTSVNPATFSQTHGHRMDSSMTRLPHPQTGQL